MALVTPADASRRLSAEGREGYMAKRWWMVGALVIGLGSPAWARHHEEAGHGAEGKTKAQAAKEAAGPPAAPAESMPPGLHQRGQMPKGLEQQEQTPAGWGKGKRRGWTKPAAARSPARSQKPEKPRMPEKPAKPRKAEGG